VHEHLEIDGLRAEATTGFQIDETLGTDVIGGHIFIHDPHL
jgi:hypothetical protein